MLPARIKDPRRWVTPEPLNVSPELVGLPLATPARRAVAILIDVALVGLLSGVSGSWLLGGLALVILQLRSRRGATSGPRMAVGWVGAVLIALLALQALGTQWDEWRRPSSGTHAAQKAQAPAADDATADAEDGAASVPASTAASSAPRLSDTQRIAQLEAELAEARRTKPLRLRDRLSSLIDDIGLGLGWGIVYFALLPAWWGGQTVGKKLMRMRVVELTGKPLTVRRCLRRYGGYMAGMATFGLGYTQLLWDPNRQAIQDRTAHTVVLDLRAARQPPPAAEEKAVPATPPAPS